MEASRQQGGQQMGVNTTGGAPVIMQAHVAQPYAQQPMQTQGQPMVQVGYAPQPVAQGFAQAPVAQAYGQPPVATYSQPPVYAQHAPVAQAYAQPIQPVVKIV